MDKITLEDYMKIYDLLIKVREDKNSKAAEELYEMFQPLVLRFSKDPVTNKFNDELNAELRYAIYKAIVNFDIIYENNICR